MLQVLRQDTLADLIAGAPEIPEMQQVERVNQKKEELTKLFRYVIWLIDFLMNRDAKRMSTQAMEAQNSVVHRIETLMFQSLGVTAGSGILGPVISYDISRKNDDTGKFGVRI